MPTLHLIPSPIAEPIQLPEEIADLRYFVVENLREARRFLKWNFKELDIDACSFLEINKNDLDKASIQPFLQKAFNAKADVGLLSDAGVPCVADPGSLVAERAHNIGFRVKPLVGPSSLLLALMASGFNGQSFAFHGYLPIKDQDQIRMLKGLEQESGQRDMTQMFIETPFRNNKLLERLIENLHPNTRLCVACDLQSDKEEIVSKPVRDWKNEKRDFHKRPAVFLVYAR